MNNFAAAAAAAAGGGNVGGDGSVEALSASLRRLRLPQEKPLASTGRNLMSVAIADATDEQYDCSLTGNIYS